LAIGTVPLGADVEKGGLTDQPIAVSKVLVSDNAPAEISRIH
jgi:hypothetical protein